MNRCVLQLHTKKNNKSQFADNMEALRLYASTAHKSDINSMNILFAELEEPMVAETMVPKEVITTDKDELITTTVSRFKETIYNKQIKKWTRYEKTLKASIQSIYYVVWRKFSNLMQDNIIKSY